MASRALFNKVAAYCAENDIESYIIDDGSLVVNLVWRWAVIPPDNKPIGYTTKPVRTILKNPSCNGHGMSITDFEKLING